VATDVGDSVAVVEVRGDLVTLTAARFDGWVRERLGGHHHVVVDLDGVAFLASAGIAVLVRLRQGTARQGAGCTWPGAPTGR